MIKVTGNREIESKIAKRRHFPSVVQQAMPLITVLPEENKVVESFQRRLG
jgi:hypothetical protein